MLSNLRFALPALHGISLSVRSCCSNWPVSKDTRNTSKLSDTGISARWTLSGVYSQSSKAPVSGCWYVIESADGGTGASGEGDRQTHTDEDQRPQGPRAARRLFWNPALTDSEDHASDGQEEEPEPEQSTVDSHPVPHPCVRVGNGTGLC
jgi:hypothetical protein